MKSPRKAVPPGPKKGPKKFGGPTKGPMKKVAGKGRVKAIWAFEAVNSDEVDMQVGDIATLLDDRSNDWWKIELRGKSGIVPKSYVSKI